MICAYSVLIAKMDGSANEISEFQPTHFPTLLLFKGKADIKKYIGDRTCEAMAEWVNNNL